MVNGHILTVLFMMAFCVTGCSTAARYRAFEGPDYPQDQIATLKGYHHVYVFGIGHSEQWLSIFKVDGEYPPDRMHTTVIELLPGEHCVSVVWFRGGKFYLAPPVKVVADKPQNAPSFSTVSHIQYASAGQNQAADSTEFFNDRRELCFMLMAGRTYEVRHTVQHEFEEVEKHWFWIVDQSNGEMVAGQTPSHEDHEDES